MIKKSLRAYITGGQLVKFVLPTGKAVGLLFCQFFKQQIHRVLIFLVILQHLHGVQHFQQCCKILLLHRGFIMQISDQGGSKSSLSDFSQKGSPPDPSPLVLVIRVVTSFRMSFSLWT